jgi:hypothetical protein
MNDQHQVDKELLTKIRSVEEQVPAQTRSSRMEADQRPIQVDEEEDGEEGENDFESRMLAKIREVTNPNSLLRDMTD